MGDGDFGFGRALDEYLRSGKKVARRGWNGKGMFITVQVPDENSKMRQPYIYIVPSESGVDTIPWVASQRDLLEMDWYEVIY